MESTALVPTHPGLDRLVTLVTDSVSSVHSKVAYAKALNDFLVWYRTEADGAGLSKATVQRFANYMEAAGLSAATINLRLSVIRKLAMEAADAGLLDAATAGSIARARGRKRAGVRMGNWLTKEQAQALLAAPDATRLLGVRDRAILAVMLGCGLRRSEVSGLEFNHIQQRNGRWVICDLLGKGRKLRSIPTPSFCKVAIDRWKDAAELVSGRVFLPLNNRGELTGSGRLLEQNIMELVIRYGQQIGVECRPHDLRRTFAHLSRQGGAQLEQIQLSLGHASIQTTERYLGTKQDLQNAPCDVLGLRTPD